MKLFAMLLFLVCLSVPVFAEDLKLEGIMYEAKDPEQSVVMLNGAFLKSGDTFQGYKILEIKPDSVKVSHSETGEIRELSTVGDKLDPASGSVAKEATSVPQAVPKEKKSTLGGGMLSPFSALVRAKEAVLLADLRRLHVAAAIYYSEYGDMPVSGKPEPITLAKLIERGLVSRAYESGVKGGYKFDLKPDQGGIGVSADPVNSNEKARHFYIDGHGELFVEEGKLATDRSPLYEI